MLLLGIDLGTSFVKVSVVDSDTREILCSVQYPEEEEAIISLFPGWAEQNPKKWWSNTKAAILKANASRKYNSQDIAAIGIAYQMHGLVIVDKNKKLLRNSIIWCDGRAAGVGQKAFEGIGQQKCLTLLLNSPGNFTAAKLAWIKENEPALFNRVDKIMLPGDFIAMMLTGELTITPSGLSEGILWDFQESKISEDILHFFGFSESLFSAVQPVCSVHGLITANVAQQLGFKAGVPVSYKAGDQLNNALSLNVMQPGEVAATAGTSGVVYAVSERLCYDELSRVNSFAHINHTENVSRIGSLLCINGAGIFNRWIKSIAGTNIDYTTINTLAEAVHPGSNGLLAMPFGNGAERMLQHKNIGAHFLNIDFNKHTTSHLLRAVQESIAFAFRYGLDIMRENDIYPQMIRGAAANLFLSNLFVQVFADVNNVCIELYDGDGSYGAAIGAGIGAGMLDVDCMQNRKPFKQTEPKNTDVYNNLYHHWKDRLEKYLAENK